LPVETVDTRKEKVARMKRILDLDKKIDETQAYMEYLEDVKEYIEDINLKKSADEKLSKEEASHDNAGHLSTDMYEKVKEGLSKYENSIEERIQSFVENAHKYDGILEKMFKWCKNLETHLINYRWETIPDKDVRQML